MHGGRKIEIGDSRGRGILCAATGEWVEQRIGFRRWATREVFGCKVQVMSAADLVAYKAVLGSEVDRQDIRELGGLR
ncbi:hypothetical protein [Mangrovicoccus sp. HB161399]|uniref:hypothetical protein n=1 Tax=Mangrovicoccus sp. HB161399 TaxID=2720392 RepID=UPI00155576DB|nr:hypothetical protein [Mangrovicoccus sp. HB161399]